MDLALKRPSRVLLGALVLAYAAGTPGLGIDTRTGASPTLGAVYTIAVLVPLIALGASWKWPRAAAWSSIVGGVLAAVRPRSTSRACSSDRHRAGWSCWTW